MHIKIAAKLRPFSHRPGIRCLIPYSTWEAQIFPAKIFFHNLASGQREELSIPLSGPVKGFTVLQDLEKGRIEVFGKTKEGYFRNFLNADELSFIQRQELPESQKRLSLGFHKKQDWDLIQRRGEMGEIFPFWLRLAELIPEIPLPEEPIGTSQLLRQGHLALTFQAAFQGILCPRLQDENHLGLIPDIEVDPMISPLGLLHEGARQIEALFFKDEDDTLSFLPKLPKEFHAGRFINLKTRHGDLIDMEWSKKELKKVIIRPASTRSIRLKLQSQIHSFRVQKNSSSQRDQALELQEGKTLYLDRFKH